MVLIALLLIVEGLSTGLWIARVVPMLGGFGLFALLLAVLRCFVGAMQLTGGVFLIGGRRSAVSLSRTALIASAFLTTFEIGGRITPNNLVPGLRWPLVIAYWIYALMAAGYLQYVDKSREVREEKSPEVGEDKGEVRAEKGSEVREDKGAEVGEEKTSEVGEEKSSEVGEYVARQPEPRSDDTPPTDDPTESGHRPRLFE